MSARQGSNEWLRERMGHATASRFADVLAKIKAGEAASRRNYRAQLIAERLTGVPADSYSNAAMQWGTETEPYARFEYEAKTGYLVEEVGFIRHAEIMAGASADGLVNADGAVEFKCPTTATHIDTLLWGMSPEHIPQIQGVMWICGRQWVEFVSFDPRLPEKLQLYVHRVPRDQAYIDALEVEVRKFLSETDAVIAELQGRVS